MGFKVSRMELSLLRERNVDVVVGEENVCIAR